uniref:Uncharacterized protein n=1 Tax=Rousettus aegyptiacus TaxID=9407 RepID=A0A7J8KB36_ROUAE|nr:hypothetical protein HJG63_007866 [Rousettus aegyptiacus]
MLRINPEKQEVSGIVRSLPRQCKPSLTDNQGPGLQGFTLLFQVLIDFSRLAPAPWSELFFATSDLSGQGQHLYPAVFREQFVRSEPLQGLPASSAQIAGEGVMASLTGAYKNSHSESIYNG